MLKKWLKVMMVLNSIKSDLGILSIFFIGFVVFGLKYCM